MENYRNNSQDKNTNFFFPIAFILAIIPLIVRMAVVKFDSATINVFGPGQAINTDLFSQKKAFYLMLFCIILIAISIIFFKKIFRKTDKIVNSILIASGVFLLLTLLSSVFSQYKQTSFLGIFDRAEGFITLACYMIIFIYSIYTFKTTNNYKYVIIPIFILVAINSFLGVFQYTGHDLLHSKLGTSIILPSKYNNDSAKIDLVYEKGKLYGTLFHYNYVGSFVAIVLPILFSLMIFEKNVIKKIIFGIGSLLSIWLLFGSTSRAGIIGVSVATIFGIIIFAKNISKKRKPLLIGFASIILIAIGLNFATKGIIFERIPSLVVDTFSIFNNTNDFDYTEHTPVKDIKHVDKGIEIILPNETLKISYGNEGYTFKNSKDEIVEYTKNDKTFTTANEAFKNISFSTGKLNKNSITFDGLLLAVNQQPEFMFKKKQDNSIHLIDFKSQKEIEIGFPETIGFKGKEKLGSMRGYIWSRSLPLLKDNLILGAGPDTFAYKFPQNDLIGKYYAYDTPNMVVDKPHNLYLQVALNNGLIALLAFLAIMLIYIVDSMKLYALKEEYNKSQMLGSVTCLGVIGYLFAGIFNDSVISVAPVFWIVLGVGVAINFMNRKELKITH